MSNQLQIKIEKEDNKDIVSFAGSIDEDSDFSPMEGLTKTEVILDLELVNFINSCGIREWIKYQEQLDPKIKLIYRKCPQVIVEQMNIVKGFVKAGGVIESFYAPYYDESTDTEVKKLIAPSDVKDNKAPVVKNADGNDMEFDDIEAQYFNFLKNI